MNLITGKCFETGNYDGHDIDDIVDVIDASKCQKLCQEHIECKFWTYDSAHGYCWRQTENAYKHKNTCSDCTRGQKFCLAAQSCFEKADYHGNDIQEDQGDGFWTSDADECQKSCQDISSCKYWTLILVDDGGGLCYRKHSKNFVEHDADNAISGSKYCTSKGR